MVQGSCPTTPTRRLADLALLEAQKLTVRVLKQVMEEKLDRHNVQLAHVTPGKGFEILDEVKPKEIIDAM